MDTPYTQVRSLQYRGPSTSDDYNTRILENYRDIVVLMNQARVLREVVREGFGQLVKDHDFMNRHLTTLDGRITSLETNAQALSSTLHDPDSTELDRFIGSAFEIPTNSQLTRDTRYGVLTLPRIDSSSSSRLSFTDPSGQVQIPSSLEIRVQGDDTSADTGTAIIDSSDPLQAVAQAMGRVWERNVIVNTPDINGAMITMYVQVPTDLFTSANSNALIVSPFPTYGVDVLEVSYTTAVNVFLQDTDGYTPLNSQALYTNDTAAVSWVAPGSWDGDTIVNCSPRAFYFDPQPITGLRIKLRQNQYYSQGSQYVYSYGMSLLDLRYDKFLGSGITMVRITPGQGQTISAINDVQPKIYNVAQAELPDVFSYRVIWETSFGSGIYTLTPVPNSQRVWLEVTLNATANSGTPALSGLSVDYS